MATEADLAERRALYDVRLKAAMEQVEAEAQPALRRLRGEPEPSLRRRKHVPKMGERIVQRTPNPFYPSGAEWFYARWCALECAHLWTPPPEALALYLASGDPALADAAISGASLHSTFRGPDSVSMGPGWHAAWSALYAATGNIAAAAQCAIDALSFAAAETADREAGARLPREDRIALIAAARGRLQVHFATAAKEIMEGENAT